jgi:hypothetical protein
LKNWRDFGCNYIGDILYENKEQKKRVNTAIVTNTNTKIFASFLFSKKCDKPFKYPPPDPNYFNEITGQQMIRRGMSFDKKEYEIVDAKNGKFRRYMLRKRV